MKESTLPWWRRALQFALGGIAGLFRRNGKVEAVPQAAQPPEDAAYPPEEENEETENPKEETRVNPSFPHSEPVPAKEAAVPRFEPAEPKTPSVSAATEEPAAAEPDPSAATTPPDRVAPPEEATETMEIAAVAVPQEVAAPEKETGPEPEASSNEEAISDPMETPPVASEPAPIAASASQGTTGSQVESASDEATAPEVPPPGECESAHAAEAAPVEEATEAIAIAAPEAEVTPKEATAPKPEAAREEKSTSHEMETPVQESEPAPPSEPIAAAVPPAPALAPPQEIAPILPFAEKPERTTAEKVAAALKARGEDADQSPFSVLVNQVYDGPLDLLLDLIRKQDIDIYDIPIARITAQFLAYVDQLRAGDMDVAGDFIYTAALLIHIKSKMLLPRAPAGPDDDAEDPRRELVERLLEHERFKNAAQMLLEKQMLEYATWSNPGIREFQEDSAAEPEIAADTTDLVRVFSDILERARNRPIIDVEEDSVTVGQMIQFLARRLTMEDRPVALRRMLSHTKSERALIAMFLALLELVRLQAILLRQDRHFSEIFIKKHAGFDALMNQGLANARDDWR